MQRTAYDLEDFTSILSLLVFASCPVTLYFKSLQYCEKFSAPKNMRKYMDVNDEKRKTIFRRVVAVSGKTLIPFIFVKLTQVSEIHPRILGSGDLGLKTHT